MAVRDIAEREIAPFAAEVDADSRFPIEAHAHREGAQHADTVREHRRLYQTAGVTGVERLHYEGSDAALTPEQLKALGAELDARLYMTATTVCAFVERTFNVIYTSHAMAKLLNRLSLQSLLLLLDFLQCR